MIHTHSSRRLPTAEVRSILIRSTNWIGDAVMTLPAYAAVRKTYPDARITTLAKPWVADLLGLYPLVDEILPYHDPGIHEGIGGKKQLIADLNRRGFDLAILFQNAIEAALLAFLARIPIRAGYDTDARRFLLSHPVRRTAALKKISQRDYYLHLVYHLGCREGDELATLPLRDDYILAGRVALARRGITGKKPLLGVAPGASYGPAKRWPPDRFAAVIHRLSRTFAMETVLMGSDQDRSTYPAADPRSAQPVINLMGETTLKEAIGIIRQCNLFIANDSGLMHIAGLLGTPLVALFGSTNPVTTGPLGNRRRILHHPLSCGPCLKKECPRAYECLDAITIDEVCRAAATLLQEPSPAKP